VTPPTKTGSEFRFDVLGIGCTAVDERLYVSEFPSPDGKARILRREKSLGGLTAIALVAAARMGARAAFAGRLGSDELSNYVECALEQCGVATGDVVRCANARPGRSTILIDESVGTRAVLSEVLGLRGADEARPPADLVQQSRVLYVDGHGVSGSIRAARIARESGRPVVGDFERTQEGDFETLLGLVDHLIVPAEFAAAWTGCDDLAVAASALLDPGRSAVVVTRGSHGGCYCVAGQRPRPYSALGVEARDTTGCGDVFHGVYAAGLAFGWDIETRIRYAAAAAALKAAAGSGPQAVPERARIEESIAVHFHSQ
jgi:ribokinase